LARHIYHSRGDEFNEWHRSLEDKIAALDIDLVSICHKCYEPLCLYETAFDKDQTHKATTATRRLAERANLPSFLIFYNVPVTRLRVRQLTPTLKEERIIRPDTLIRYFNKLQSEHHCEGIKKPDLSHDIAW